MRTVTLAATLAGATAAVAVPAHATTERVVTKHYLGAPSSAGLVFCGAPRPVVDGAGRACSSLLPGETTMSGLISDTSGLPVAGRIVFFGRDTGIGEPLDEVGSASFCTAIAGVAIPATATHLDIEIGDRVERTDRPCGALTSGTYGTVTARFS